ncbi:hypothetical protein [Ferrimonas marina]|uniref:Uncharacterized protein n=1 Tax=Ferrimonas marina TaxID=299255 RepID=A0A1M5NFS7_9GAMM|nr:hypothetical protein [Ferrimonas marina]SHG88370.1 hypothetical protein SAMN02745129_1036 [Ferrimonas marina]
MPIFTCDQTGIQIPFLPSRKRSLQFRQLQTLASQLATHPQLGPSRSALLSPGVKSIRVQCRHCQQEGQVAFRQLKSGKGSVGCDCQQEECVA